MPAVDAAALMADTRKLASDEFGGRAPGSPGEELTVNYLVEQFKAAGAEPGNPDGTWVQKVPLVSLTATDISPLVVKKGARAQSFKPHDQVVAFSQRVTDAVAVKDSEIVFVGTACRRRNFSGTTSRAWTSRARRSWSSSTIRPCPTRPIPPRSTRRRSAARP